MYYTKLRASGEILVSKDTHGQDTSNNPALDPYLNMRRKYQPGVLAAQSVTM
jgi:hypothetical protein